MKKLLLFLFMVVLLQDVVLATQNKIIFKTVRNKEKVDKLRVRSLSIQVLGYYNTQKGQMILYFPQNIGDAAILLTDVSGDIVFSSSVDTGTSSLLELPLPEQSGMYTLSVVFGSYEATGRIVL